MDWQTGRHKQTYTDRHRQAGRRVRGNKADRYSRQAYSHDRQAERQPGGKTKQAEVTKRIYTFKVKGYFAIDGIRTSIHSGDRLTTAPPIRQSQAVFNKIIKTIYSNLIRLLCKHKFVDCAFAQENLSSTVIRSQNKDTEVWTCTSMFMHYQWFFIFSLLILHYSTRYAR